MRSLAAVILAFVFFDELAVMTAFGVWGWQRAPLPAVAVVVLPLLAMSVWFFFASPKAKYGGPVVRPAVKLAVFGVGCALLWDAGHEGWAIALFAASAVINGLAQLPFVRQLVADLAAESTR